MLHAFGLGLKEYMKMAFGNPVEENPRKVSNQRFRSFAERFLVTRSEFFRKDPEGLQEDTWQCILDAKTAYNLIKQVGLGVED